LFLAIICTFSAGAQTFEELLAKGKEIIKNERKKTANEKTDYSEAISVLEQAVKMQPNNPEGHYFLGNAYDYDNNSDATSMNVSNREATIKISKEFETVNKLAPNYYGEKVALDPYSKISSIWASLAFSYLLRNNHDSARWAFSEGRKRGGFSDYALKMYRYVLKSCANNSIYFTFGDFANMSLWYLQEMENLRHDVTIVNLSMLQVPWYTIYLNKVDPSLFSTDEVAADTTLYSIWETKEVQVPIKNMGKDFNWTLRPSQMDKYIVRSDLELINIISNNKFRREVYFVKGSDPSLMMGLDSFVEDCFTIDRLGSEKQPERGKTFLENLNAFPVEMMSSVNPFSEAETYELNNIRVEYCIGVQILMKEDKKAEALKLFTKMEKAMPVSRYPYNNEDIENYVEGLKEKVK